MTPAEKSLFEIEAHQKLCEQRYKEIERRLEEGSAKFRRLEMLIWGIYPFIVTIFLGLLFNQ